MEKKELIWVSKELAEKFKECDSDEAKESILLKAIENKKTDIEFELSTMEERMQVFKLMSLKHKQALQKIRDEEYEMLEPLWIELQKIEPSIRERADNLKKHLYPLRQEIESLVKMVQDVNTWKVDNLTKLINTINSFSEKDLDKLKMLIEYGSKKD